MKRLFDLLLALLAIALLTVPILWVAIAVRLTSQGPVLYWSDRVGRHNRIFKMPKFRTMKVDTPSLARSRRGLLCFVLDGAALSYSEPHGDGDKGQLIY